MGLTGLHDSQARVLAFYSLALTSISLSERPLLYETKLNGVKLNGVKEHRHLKPPMWKERALQMSFKRLSM